jgi:hypothetical protein
LSHAAVSKTAKVMTPTHHTNPEEHYLAEERRGIILGAAPTTPEVEEMVRKQIEERRRTQKPEWPEELPTCKRSPSN